MKFAAIDFETANTSRSSVCAAGLAIFDNGNIVAEKEWLVRPEPFYFDAINTSIHGITEEDVANAPSFLEVWPEIYKMSEGLPMVAHNAAFDMSCIRGSLSCHNAEWPVLTYGCTYKLARTVIPSLLSYSLDSVAESMGYTDFESRHHDALEDAKMCGLVLVNISSNLQINKFNDLFTKNGLTLGSITQEDYLPCSSPYGAKHTSTKKPSLPPTSYVPNENASMESPLWGKSVVFTGSLHSMQRSDAFEKVAEFGGKVSNTVNKKTNYLVVGSYTRIQLRDNLLSSKLQKAYEIIQSGHKLQILTEKEFLSLLK